MNKNVKLKKPLIQSLANNNLMFTAIGVGVLAVILLITTFIFFQKSRQMEQRAIMANTELQAMKKPKYDTTVDLLTEQCEMENVACISTTTRTPNVELLKFLVNFKQYENTQYRLFLEIQNTDEVVTTPFKYECNAGKKAFYICQDISATHPADVLRVFERSYATLSPNATYQFNLMVKPTAEQQTAAPIRMTPKNNLVLTDKSGNVISNNSLAQLAQQQNAQADVATAVNTEEVNKVETQEVVEEVVEVEN